MKRTIICAAGLALLLCACQENRLEQDVPAREMSFNVLAPGVQTRASAESFEPGDRIGLYVADYLDASTPMPLQISGNRANNVEASFDGTSWTTAKQIWWGNSKADVYAYYPYIDAVSEIDNQYFSVAEDQDAAGADGVPGGYEASDFLWAKAEGVSRTDGTVNLAMKHLMSKLTVRIVAGEDYIGSLPSDASVLLHNTVTAARLDLAGGSVVKDPYSGARSINMKKLGVRTSDGVEAVVFEAIVVPQMLETSVPLLEINSKSVSYLLEDSFNFRPGVTYTYTATLNTSTTAIKVEIGCEIEDWNSAGGSSEGDGGEGGSGEGGDSGDDGKVYTDLSAEGTANCYLVSQAGDYKFKAVIGNTDGNVGNVKSVEVLWESFGTDVMPEVGSLIGSVSYRNGYVRFSTPETFANGNAVIAVRNSKGNILWSWHIWCSEEGWQEQVYLNNAGTMMDRNLGATSATPGDVGALGLLYQWGRKDPFLGSSSISSSVQAVSTGTWSTSSSSTNIPDFLAIMNPMVFYTEYDSPNEHWSSKKTAHDPCPVGWRIPEGGDEGIWKKAGFAKTSFDNTNRGIAFDIADGGKTWYPASGYLNYSLGGLYASGNEAFYWSLTPTNVNYEVYALFFSYYGTFYPSKGYKRHLGCAVRCLRE